MVMEIKVNRHPRRAEAFASHLATRKVFLPETVRVDAFSGLQPSGPGIASVWESIISISHQCRNSRGQKWAPPSQQQKTTYKKELSCVVQGSLK